MVLYKNTRKSKFTLKERLIKNKQYLKRRLLRISKRANWLKRKNFKRLKQLNKSRRISAHYSQYISKKINVVKYVKVSKTKHKKFKIKNFRKKFKEYISNKAIKSFNVYTLATKILKNRKSTKILFMYFLPKVKVSK